MNSETVAVIVVAVFQAIQTMLMSMGIFILKDLRDRVNRLESIEMEAKKNGR